MASREHYFAVDLMCYVANKYNLNWTPREERKALSPFTGLTKIGIEAALLEWILVGIDIFRPILDNPLSSQFRKVSNHIVQVGIASGKDFLYVCTAVARTALQFYVFGQHDAPDIAIEVIESALNIFQRLHGSDIFRRFNQVIEDLAATRNNG